MLTSDLFDNFKKRNNGRSATNESNDVCPVCGQTPCNCTHISEELKLDEKCWDGYHKDGNKEMFGKTVPNCVKNEAEELEEKWSEKYKRSINCNNPKGFSQKAHCAGRKKNEDIQEHKCPDCGGPMFEAALMNEKKDACYYKVKSRYKVWPSAYASGALVQCRKKGASNWGSKSESIEENLRDWFKEKWVRFGPDGEIRGSCARGSEGEGKPKCLPQAKAHALGKKGRASAAARKRREDPNPERSGKAINVATKKKSNESVAEGSGKNVVKSIKVGNFRHDLVDTGMGWQVRIYNGDELYDTGMSKNSEQKGLAALEDAVAYTEKQTRTKRQGVAEGLNEMDKSAPQPGRDGRVSHSTYGSRDKKGSDYFTGKEAPSKPITKKQMGKDALDILKKQGVAEGLPHDVDHMPGPTVKNPQTGCKRCHGKGYVYKDEAGQVYPSNQPGTKTYKCGKCKGHGFVKQDVKESVETGVTQIDKDTETLNKLDEAITSIQLADMLFKGIEQRFPEVVKRYGHEVVADAVMDVAEENQTVHSMNEVSMLIDDVFEKIQNRLDDKEVEEDKEHTPSSSDLELIQTQQYAAQHYPQYKDNPEKALQKYILRSLKHSEEDDKHQNTEIHDLEADVARIKAELGINETRMYYNVISTPANNLRKDFGMRKDSFGWFLSENSSPKYIMEAQRAFGAPKLIC